MEEELKAKPLRLTKDQRRGVWDKSGGRCWYCGCVLPSKWHVDHVEPVERFANGAMEFPERDVIGNLVPACIPCNNFKWRSSVEWFRKNIRNMSLNAIKASGALKAAQRMGILKLKETPIVFYFERMEQED